MYNKKWVRRIFVVVGLVVIMSIFSNIAKAQTVWVYDQNGNATPYNVYQYKGDNTLHYTNLNNGNFGYVRIQ